MLTDLRRASVSLISVALAFSALAQPKSAVEFYDTTGTTPVARFGWQGESGTGKFFVDAPPGTEAMSIQNRNLTAAGEVAATRFRGDGSTLAGIGSASIADGGVQTADLQDSAVT